LKRLRFDPGAVLRVPLDDEWHTYARMLSDSPFLAYYDCRTREEIPDPREIVKSDVLFVVATSYHRWGHRWTRVGMVPLADADVAIPLRFVQPDGAPERLRLTDHLGNEWPATYDECVGLERAAVWHPELVEERLNDHYAGRPNDELASDRLIDPAGRG
jgi:hypothetical protein